MCTDGLLLVGTDGGTLAALRLPASAGAAGAGAATPGAPADGAAAPVRGESPARCEAAPSAHGPTGGGGAPDAGACKPGTPACADGAASAARGQLPDDVGANMADWNLLEGAPRPAGSSSPSVGADGDAANPQPDPAAAAGPAAAPAPDQAAERAPDAAAAAEASESCESIAQSSQARACKYVAAADAPMTCLPYHRWQACLKRA